MKKTEGFGIKASHDFFLFHIFDFEHIRTPLCCPLKDVAISIQNSVLLLAFEVKISP